MNFLNRLFGSRPESSESPEPSLKPEFDASVVQRLAAAGKDPHRVEAVPAELLEMPVKPALPGFSGMVRLELTMNESGKVVAVEMNGAPFECVSALESWAHTWAFAPARMEGKAHPCRMVFEVTWEPK